MCKCVCSPPVKAQCCCRCSSPSLFVYFVASFVRMSCRSRVVNSVAASKQQQKTMGKQKRKNNNSESKFPHAPLAFVSVCVCACAIMCGGAAKQHVIIMSVYSDHCPCIYALTRTIAQECQLFEEFPFAF